MMSEMIKIVEKWILALLHEITKLASLHEAYMNQLPK